HDVGNELRMRLRLVEAAHDSKCNPQIALRHESRNDGVQWPFAAGQHVRAARVESEKAATILEDEPCSRGHQTGAEGAVIALDVRNHVSLGIHRAQVSGIVAHRQYLARWDVTIGFGHINELSACAGVIFREHLLYGHRIESRIAYE